MIGTLDILNAINAQVKDHVPELAEIYVEFTPNGFLRPSLLIEAVSHTEEAASKHLVRRVEIFSLKVFTELDDYSYQSMMEALALRQKIELLFRGGFLPVGDRNLNLTASPGKNDWGEVWLELRVEYFDNRDETPDTTPVIESLHTSVTLKHQ